ncbi:MAG TPA: type II secretion system protein [Dehalococcoidales bacterium]|nr:type II secretion system protein [Dehalococcoidales bacterium]
MRIPERGEKGFTLIELLIVVAILGVLAAVVIPNVGRFIGRGEEEAADTEFSNIQTAVISMMTDNGLSELPAGYVDGTVIAATDNMSLFPHSTAACVTVKKIDPNGNPYTASDKAGYVLYQHDIAADNSTATTVNYVATGQTKGTYYVNASGTVTQATTGY